MGETVPVIGVGAVGETLTRELANLGFTTVSFSPSDVDEERSHLPHARFYIVDVPSGVGTQRVAIRVLRKMHAKAPLTPILAVLHSPALKALNAALEAGASDVIDAPYDTAALSKRLLVLRERLRRAAEPAPRAIGPELSALAVRRPDLHDPESGLVDARLVADALGISLARMARGLDVDYKAIHKTPTAARLQKPLMAIKEVLHLIGQVYPAPAYQRVWLNQPLADLEGESPLDVILSGEAAVVASLLEDALAGQPG